MGDSPGCGFGRRAEEDYPTGGGWVVRRTYLVPLIVVLILAVAAGAYVLWPRSRAPESLVGRHAPAIALKELATGQTVRLPADLSGQPYSIQFFSYG